MLSFDLRPSFLANEAVSGTGGNSSELDATRAEGNIFLDVSARAGGTNTMSITVEHSETTGTGFTAVPASALFNVLTGEADVFDDVTTLATDQFLGLNLQQLKRFVRVVYSGTGLVHEIAVVAIYQPKYTENS